MSININIISDAIIERNSVIPLNTGKLIDINVLNGLLGNASEVVARKTAKHYG